MKQEDISQHLQKYMKEQSFKPRGEDKLKKLYYNAKVYSIDEKNSVFQAVGIEDNKICFLGSNEDSLSFDADEKIDLQGATVLPGFIDSHLHLLNYAFVAESFKMFDVRSIQNVIEEGRLRVEKMKDLDQSHWLYGRGWNHQNFSDEERFLTRHDLDKISTERPILFIRVCGHVAAVNTIAMEIVKGLPQTKDYLDQIDFENGILTEASVKLCYNAMNTPSVEEVKKYILAVQNDYNKRGITSIESDNFLSLPGRNRQNIVAAHRQLASEGLLTLRIREQASFTAFEDMKVFIDEGNRTGDGDGFYTIGPIKLYQDGSLGARTALMNEPYVNDGDNCGLMVHTKEDLQNCVDYAYDHGMQILVHTIGDKASDMVCDAYEEAISKYGKKENRLAINHLQIVSPDLIERMQKNDFLAYIQPVFVASDKAMVDKLVGEERSKLSYLWKSMVDAGLTCCGGSDSPVEDFDVLSGIQLAVTRDCLGENTEGWHPEEKLSVYEAVKLFTINNAYGAFEEKVKGSLELGKLADMVVLGEDIFEVDPHEIYKIPIMRTIVDGKEVWKA